MKIQIKNHHLDILLDLNEGRPMRVTGLRPDIVLGAICKMGRILTHNHGTLPPTVKHTFFPSTQVSQSEVTVWKDDWTFSAEIDGTSFLKEELSGHYKRDLDEVEFHKGYKGSRKSLAKSALPHNSFLRHLVTCNGAAKNPVLADVFESVDAIYQEDYQVRPEDIEHMLVINKILLNAGRMVMLQMRGDECYVVERHVDMVLIGATQDAEIKTHMLDHLLWNPLTYPLAGSMVSTRTMATVCSILTVIHKNKKAPKVLDLDLVYPECREAILNLANDTTVLFQCEVPVGDTATANTSLKPSTLFCRES